MKFIHIADVHFDMPLIALSGNREMIKNRRTEQKKAFHDVIQYAKKMEVDCLFIAGDLFEHKFVEKSTIDYILSNFQLIPEVSIFITPGNHDPFMKKSPYETVEWPENVTIFKSEYGMISLEDADIYGVGFENFEMNTDVIPSIKIEDENKINVLITHGTLNGAGKKYHDIKAKDLDKFDYVALGHIHDKKIDDSNIIYPGSLLSCGFDEPGEHGFVFGEITNEIHRIEFKKLDYRGFNKIEIDLTKYQSFTEVLDDFYFGEDFYEVKLLGIRNFDTDELIESMKERSSNICKIKDLTRPAYKFDIIKKENNLKGIFTKKMLDEIDDMTEEEAEEAYRIIDIIYQMMK